MSTGIEVKCEQCGHKGDSGDYKANGVSQLLCFGCRVTDKTVALRTELTRLYKKRGNYAHNGANLGPIDLQIQRQVQRIAWTVMEETKDAALAQEAVNRLVQTCL